MFPKFSAPLNKSIRTGEGLLVYATNIALTVAAILPHGLSWTHSALYLTILNGVHVISRSSLKIAAVNKAIGIDGGPIEPVALEQQIASLEDAVEFAAPPVAVEAPPAVVPPTPPPL